jgi:molybdopterin-guanine dinucleotide biosynthesis protein B
MADGRGSRAGIAGARLPKIAVIGRKKTGKTSVVEALVRGLKGRGYRLATVKHIHEKGFSMDRAGTDTWRHSAAGAEISIAASEGQTALIVKGELGIRSLEGLASALGADAMILEGFSREVLGDEGIGKIICADEAGDAEHYSARAKGRLIGLYSHRAGAAGAEELVRGALDFILDERASWIAKEVLPGLNCGKCGLGSCDRMARAILAGEAEKGDCEVIRSKPSLKAEIIVGGAEVPIQRFVSELIRASVLGMISKLKGVSIEGDESIRIEVTGPDGSG